MKIHNVKPGTEVTVVAKLGTNSIEFKTKASEYEFEKFLLVEEIKNDKGEAVSFASGKLRIEVAVHLTDGPPIIFRNVAIAHARYMNKGYHKIIQSMDGIPTNRRDSYRLSVGKTAQVQIGLHKQAVEAIMKDVSSCGFSFVLDKDLPIGNDIIHIVCEYDNYTINRQATIVRKQPLPNSNRFVYGCHTDTRDRILDKFITEKQSEKARLQRKPVTTK